MVRELSAEENLLLKKALYKLGIHDYTRRGLYKKLLREKVGGDRVLPETAKAVIVFLVKSGYLNEKDYFERLYPRLKACGYGPRRIAADMGRRDFAQKYIDLVFCDEESTAVRAYTQACARVKQQHYELQETRDRQKLFSYLLRIGYDTQDAQSAVERILSEKEDSDK